jgi:hypothetical protein
MKAADRRVDHNLNGRTLCRERIETPYDKNVPSPVIQIHGGHEPPERRDQGQASGRLSNLIYVRSCPSDRDERFASSAMLAVDEGE